MRHKDELDDRPHETHRDIRVKGRQSRKQSNARHQVSGRTNPKRTRRGSDILLTALHQRVRDVLGLEALGFRAEQPVGPYFVDELHRQCRVVVEVNGDYIHANPRLHAPTDIIRISQEEFYEARTKWARDAHRQAHIERLGYRVLVVWQSDDLEMKRQELWTLLGLRPINL